MHPAYQMFERRKHGCCNICGQKGALTRDHVPPQGGINLQDVRVDRAVSAFCGLSQPSVSNHELLFRTICSQCNSRMGEAHDPHLNKLAKTVGGFFRTDLWVPPTVRVSTRPNALIRSILGHLVAARFGSGQGFFDHYVRELINDDSAAIPEDIHVFYWIYPHHQQTVLRDSLMPAVRGRFAELQRFSLLKYFPLAYLVTTASAYEGLPCLTRWRDQPSHFETPLTIDFRCARGARWPEAPAPGSFLFGGNDLMESVLAEPLDPARARRPALKADLGLRRGSTGHSAAGGGGASSASLARAASSASR